MRREELMSQPSDARREPDDVMARQSGAVSEDVQPVTTDEDAAETADGSLAGTIGAERTDEAEDRQAEGSGG
jgi:hypothetical protein